MEFTVETPEVKELLDNHDVKTDKRYNVENEALYEAWGNLISRGSLKNDKRIYVANAGEKGWGVYAVVHIKKGDLIDVYTGLRTTDMSVTKYQWNYLSRPSGKDDGPVRIGLDALVYGNWMRFVNGLCQPN